MSTLGAKLTMGQFAWSNTEEFPAADVDAVPLLFLLSEAFRISVFLSCGILHLQIRIDIIGLILRIELH